MTNMLSEEKVAVMLKMITGCETVLVLLFVYLDLGLGNYLTPSSKTLYMICNAVGYCVFTSYLELMKNSKDLKHIVKVLSFSYFTKLMVCFLSYCFNPTSWYSMVMVSIFGTFSGILWVRSKDVGDYIDNLVDVLVRIDKRSNIDRVYPPTQQQQHQLYPPQTPAFTEPVPPSAYQGQSRRKRVTQDAGTGSVTNNL